MCVVKESSMAKPLTEPTLMTPWRQEVDMDHEPQADNRQSREMFWAMGTIHSALQPTARTTHVQSALPYLQLATCLLVYLFMPHDHGDHQRRRELQTHQASEEHQP
jgi:hypothetical protein